MGAHVLVDEVYLEACFDSPGQIGISSGPEFRGHEQLDESLRLIGIALRLDSCGERAGGAHVATERSVRCDARRIPRSC